MLTYEKSGVSIERGDEVVSRIKKIVPEIGDFGGFFPLELSGCKKPLLVAGADGVGTKIRIALDADLVDTIGIDLVAMNVNDVLCSGAKPLFFLDYIAAGKIDPNKIERIIKGIVAGCKISNCRLLGGETAEMPGIYTEGDYDLAGFAVGIVDEEMRLGAHKVREGDILLGLGSSGLHSNGYSLARAAMADKMTDSIQNLLAAPTRIYVQSVLHAIAETEIHSIAHITGGGIEGNLCRAIPKGLCAEIDSYSWSVPEIFRLIQEFGEIEEAEMRKTFNLGIGMILVLPESSVERAASLLESHGEIVRIIGKVKSGNGIEWSIGRK